MTGSVAYITHQNIDLVYALAQIFFRLFVPFVGQALIQLALGLVLSPDLLILFSPLSFQALQAYPQI